MSTKILEDLNSEQRKAVECLEGPVLIVAGAGSGKTRVLTSRIAYMIDRGTDPSRILALTFTKKAAGEMKERIAQMVGDRKARRIYMGTFHSVFIRFLREFADAIGFPPTFTIYDTSDSVSALKDCIRRLGLDDAFRRRTRRGRHVGGSHRASRARRTPLGRGLSWHRLAPEPSEFRRRHPDLLQRLGKTAV